MFAVGADPDDFVAGRRSASNGTAEPCGTSRSPNCADGLRLYFETQRADGANDLRTTFVPYESSQPAGAGCDQDCRSLNAPRPVSFNQSA